MLNQIAAPARSACRQGRRTITRFLNSGGSSPSLNQPWADYEMAPIDPIIGLTERFQKDDFPQKVIVGVGAYRDDRGKPYVLPCVREAEKMLMEQNLDMEYSGIVSFTLLPIVERRVGCLFVTKISHGALSSCIDVYTTNFRQETQSLWISHSSLDTATTRLP
jgi:hypothetical protein